MTQPSKAGALFLALFGLMFAGAGLALLLKTLADPRGPSPNNIAGLAIGLLFFLLGSGLIAGAAFGYGKLKKQAEVQQANAGSPWLWRPDWAQHRADSKNKQSVIGLWAATVLASLFATPFAVTALPQLIQERNPVMFVLIGVCAIPSILLIAAVRATIRRERFGKTYFELGSLPFSPGGKVSGAIQLHFDTNASHGIDLALKCVRRLITGSGKSRSVNETILWTCEQNVPQTAIGVGPLGAAIPVNFTLPAGVYETNTDNPDDQVLWTLHAKADVPGVDYSDNFELPVFRTSVSAAPTAQSWAPSFSGVDSGISGESAVAVETAVAEPAEDVSAPAQTKIQVSINENGTEFYLPPFRSPVRAALLFVFAVVWTGIVYALSKSTAPLPFLIAFGLADLVVIYAVFHSVLSSVTITVGHGDLVKRTSLLGIGINSRIACNEVESIHPVMRGSQAGTGGMGMYSIRMRTKGGRSRTLVDELAGLLEARWLVAQIEDAAHLKRDTKLEYDAFYSPPPQRGQMLTTPQSGQTFPSPMGPVNVRTRGPVWVGAVFLAIWMAVIGFIVFGSFTRSKVRTSSRTSSRSTGVTRQARPIPKAPLTDSDVPRLLALPPQQQAQELLERSVRHDPRALELFEQNVEKWTGRIVMTDDLRRVQNRARYSNDLRVRQAETDFELAVNGTQKNEGVALAMLEESGRDPKHRQSAVYLLGMLAGRGTAYDRIYPALVDYARHDPDPNVRQWAVEGLRFLQTDDALAQEFESFTSDPSFAVRNRAGCNVSDCGIFTRKQRMAMVPKLIALVEDPKTQGQMRDWSFLALREITDANLPNDAAQWRRWYEQHGADKIAEFERMPWWQVRGDD